MCLLIKNSSFLARFIAPRANPVFGPRDHRRLHAGSWSSEVQSYGSCIVPLYLPPESVSDRLWYMYVPPPLTPSYFPLPPVFV
jgi:hypothetical protein